MRTKLFASLLAICAATAGCAELATAPGNLEAGEARARFGGFTMGSGNVVGTPPDATVQNTESAPASSTAADTTATERGGFTMGSGN
jgi:hypothetical protein